MAMIDRRTLLGSLALTLATGAATAQDKYPSKPIRLIVSFPPGGPLDVMARLTAQMLSASLGQIIVDNKPGAGGTLAGREAARAEPDGYTLLFGSSATLAIGATNAPFKTVQELLAYAKAHPGTLNFGVPNGAPPHMLAEMFKMQTGADIQIVPYKGASTLITDMLAGRIHSGFETTSVMLAHLHEGNIRGLAVLRNARIAELPNVPTMIESGVTGVEGSSWSGVLAPAGTPPAIVERLRTEIVAGLRSPEFAGKLKRMAADVPTTTAAEFGQFIASESTRIAAIMQAAGL